MAHLAEAAQLYIQRFYTGLITNRSALATPIRVFGRRIIELYDSMSAGSNVELTSQLSLKRRPGYLQFNTNTVTGVPLKFYSFKPNTPANTVLPMVDTTTNVYQLSSGSGAANSIISKGSNTSQTSFFGVGNYLYMGNPGSFSKKWDGGISGGQGVTNWGIAIGSVNNTTGPNTAGTGANGGGSGVAWTNPGNITSNVSNATVTTVPGTTSSQPLQATNFSFSIPSTSTILGIQVTVNLGYTGSVGILGWFANAQLLKNGTPIGNIESLEFFSTSSGQATTTFGGTADLWGQNWTYNDINQTNFGFQLVVAGPRTTSWQVNTGQVSIFSLGGPNVTTSASGGSFSATVGYQYNFCYGNSISGHVSSPTPPSGSTGAISSKLNDAISLTASTDAQVNQIRVFRTTDGGPTTVMFEIPTSPYPNIGWTFTSVANAAAGSTVYTGTTTGASGFASSVGQSFKVAGFTNGANNGTFPCTAATATTLTLTNAGGVAETHAATGTEIALDSATDSTLQQTIISPLQHANDPPPPGLNLMEWYAGRLWGAVNNLLYVSGGPDVVLGQGTEAWPPANVYVLPTIITKLVALPAGLLVFTLDEIFIVRGVDLPSFTVNNFIKDMGARQQNAVDSDGSQVYLFTSDRQMMEISSNGINEVGVVIGNQLDTLDPTVVYVTVHRSGNLDNRMFLADGSVNIYSYDLKQQSWNPAQTPVGGVQATGSIEISPGVWKFLIGATSTGQVVLQRDLSTFSDNGSNYSCSVTFGSIQLSQPGSLAHMQNIVIETSTAGTFPSVGILANEISGTAKTLSQQVTEPPELSGTTYEIQSHRAFRFPFASADIPQNLRHLQIVLTWPSEAAANELIGWAIFGVQGGSSPAGRLPEVQGR